SPNPVSFSTNQTSLPSTLTIATTGATPVAETPPFGPFTVRAVSSTAPNDAATVTGTLAVACGPAITTQPSSQTQLMGLSVTFSVSAIGATVSADGATSFPLQYQWRKGGTPISGATASSYTIAAVSASDAGSYDVLVTNRCGPVTSSAATLTVTKMSGSLSMGAQSPNPVSEIGRASCRERENMSGGAVPVMQK